ncbi:MAG: hypothetical protein J4O03_07335 [Chloroflexi bacterium]|nr:hypothetical protein [Chloroflexota bacterium]MCH8350364.1 hypothetical protein [Chloroflexota bacterium]MCI0779900.1 hypothetical protein [Chloroflexota bacterium]MCI0785713.1 hypothetical protein [Chloroflexota bacterium]MCI0793263.1 hypothetical protein [Chloroflexota bacterium]
MTEPGTPLSRRVGEVVEANSVSFVAQCYQLYDAPPLGSLVRTGEVYGVVCKVVTEPLDATRPVLARGEGAATEEEVFRDNPQLNRLLTSRFEALIAGHDQDGVHRQYLPPLPPRVHSFVYPCTPQEVASFTSRLDLLRLLINSGYPMADEVAGACLREAAPAHPDPDAFLLRAGKALAAELAGDLPRLNAVLRKLMP